MNDLLDKYICKKYPKIFINRYKSPMESCMSHGIEVNDGWFFLIHKLCEKIQNYIDYPYNNSQCTQVIAEQIKQKFSGLRFYYRGGDEYVKGLVFMTESLSYTICENCGKMDETIGRNIHGWKRTTCQECSSNIHDFKLNIDDNDELKDIWKKVKQT